jgi:hypothetical protein
MDSFVQTVRQLLGEAYEGTTKQPWFSDSGQGSGLFATLSALNAADASSTTDGSSGIAAHANHLRWSLGMANALMRGQPASKDWSESWAVKTVDEPAWTQLQADLKHEYERLLEVLPNGFDPTNPMMVTSGVALVAHAAYHLGAIRQLALRANAR